MLPPRKTKASRGSLDQDRNVPSISNPFRYKPQKGNGVKVVDVRDSDEDMEDSDEESEEDDGSVYVPSGTPSEAGGEELDDNEDLMEATPKDDCDFLELLPRELRDRIYGYVLKLDTSVSNYTLKVKCTTCPSLMDTANASSWKSQIREAHNLLRTCHQIRDEGRRVFYEVNSWSLHRARLRDTPPADSSATSDATRSLFDTLRKTKTTKHFKHISMQIVLSPLAYWDLTTPDSLDLNDSDAIHLFEMSQQPGVIASHILHDLAQCKLYKAAVSGLVESSASVFPELRSITIEVGLHAKSSAPDALKDPLNRCGITFYIRIRLERGIVPESTGLHNRSPTIRFTYKANGEATISILNDPWNVPSLEPGRDMLSPLIELHGVQSVEVERRWTVRYRQGRLENGDVAVKAQPLRRLWRFDTVDNMLKSAGSGFCNFLDPALKYLKTCPEDVVEIIENTNADTGHHLVPKSYHVEGAEAVMKMGDFLQTRRAG